MKYILATLLFFAVGCDRIAGIDFNPEVAFATAAAVDAQEDIADRPSIPDSLQGYKSGPVPPSPPAAKETKPPAGAPSQPVVVNLYSADWCIYCKAHDEYWKAREWKGNGFTVKRVTEIPDWLNEIPAYHWNTKKGSVFVHCEPKQLQESFDLSK